MRGMDGRQDFVYRVGFGYEFLANFYAMAAGGGAGLAMVMRVALTLNGAGFADFNALAQDQPRVLRPF